MHLILGCEEGASQIVNILLDTTLNTSNVGYHSVNAAQSVKNVCGEILELLLEEIDLLLRTHGPQSANIAFLNSIKQEVRAMILPLLINPNPLRVQTAVRLLWFLENQNPQVISFAASYMLMEATTTFHLAALIRLISNNVVLSCSSKSETDSILASHTYFTKVLERTFVENWNYQEPRRIFQNLTILLK